MRPSLLRKSFLVTVACVLAVASTVLLRPAAIQGAAPGVTVEASGTCLVAAGVPGDWDVWHELVLVEQDTWFPPHVHDGVECILTIAGTSTWWFPGNEWHEIPAGSTFLVPDLAAHTAGNTRPGTMRYLSAHILRPGAPFRSEICANAAPANPNGHSSTAFNWVFRSQPGSNRPLTIEQRIERFDPGAGYRLETADRVTYVTPLDGAISLVTDQGTRVLARDEQAAIPRGAQATLTNGGSTTAALVVLQL